MLLFTEYVIRNAGCPISYCSKLQTELALSTAEAKYIALLQALCEAIWLITVIKELEDIFLFYVNNLDICCKVWEDNQSFIAITESDILLHLPSILLLNIITSGLKSIQRREGSNTFKWIS